MADGRSSAYGGPGWHPRTRSHAEELGSVWASCGSGSEVAALEAVLLHEPGPELDIVDDPDRFQMLDRMDPHRARLQHRALAEAYARRGVEVHGVDPDGEVSPNLMFVADLVFMTPEGGILCRPASTVRAGEERHVARRLACMGVPILRSIRGRGVFEGADAAWLDERTVLLATGLRTNEEGARQVSDVLGQLGVTVIGTDMPPGTMHLMGQLRFLDRNLALVWPGRVSEATVRALQGRGYEILDAPDEEEARRGMALNLVTLGPRDVIMPSGNPRTQELLERRGVRCTVVDIDELARGAGGIGCMTGILARGRE